MESITIQLVSCLTGLDCTKQINMLLIVLSKDTESKLDDQLFNIKIC